MKSRDFIYWLHGFFELHSAGPKRGEPHDDMALSGYQVEMIKRHLALVFKHEIDPQAGDATAQEALNAIHTGKPKPQIGGVSHVDPDILIRC